MWTESVLSEKPNFRSEPKECENKPDLARAINEIAVVMAIYIIFNVTN